MTTARARRGSWPVLTGALVGGAVLWPVLLLAATTAHAHGGAQWSAVVYVASSQICHQRPERSFHAGGAQWPVCARCSGLYAAAPFGAIAALRGRRRRFPRALSADASATWRWSLAIAALPTAVTLGLEWSGLVSISNGIRAVAALPLGAAIAWAVVDILPVERANQVH